jgi:hypothetical protein
MNGYMFELSHWRRLVNAILIFTQAITYYCFLFLYKRMQSLFPLYNHEVVWITFPMTIHDGWSDDYIMNGHLFEISHWRRLVNILIFTQATTYHCFSFLYKWMNSLFPFLYHHEVVLTTFPMIIHDAW